MVAVVVYCVCGVGRANGGLIELQAAYLGLLPSPHGGALRAMTKHGPFHFASPHWADTRCHEGVPKYFKPVIYVILAGC